MDRRSKITGFALITILFAALGCEDPPRPVAPLPIDAQVDRGPIRADARVDQGLDAGLDMDAQPDLDAQPDVPDMAPPIVGPDDSSQIAMLSRRGETQVVWVAEGMLYAAHLSDLGEVTDTRELFAVADPLPAPLLMGRSSEAPNAWLFVPNGPDAMYQAYDVNLEAPTAWPTDIYPPAITVAANKRLILMGRSGVEGDAPMAWRWRFEPMQPDEVEDAGVVDAGDAGDAGDAAVEDAEPEPEDPRIIDPMGLPDVVRGVASLSGAVLRFTTGSCALMREGQLMGDWLCDAAEEARLVGSTERLFFVGERPDGVVAWSALPGHLGRRVSGVPQRRLIIPKASLLRWLPAVTGTPTALVRDYLCAADKLACADDAGCAPDQRCAEGRCMPLTCDGDEDCQPVADQAVRCVEGICRLRCDGGGECLEHQICDSYGNCQDTPCDPEAPVCAEGRSCTESEGVWIFEDDQARRFDWYAGDHAAAVYFGLGHAFGVHWSEGDGPVINQLRTLAHADVLHVELPNECTPPVQPESCAGNDLNCDGAAHGGRCCKRDYLLTLGSIGARLQGRWRVAMGDTRLMLMAVVAREPVTAELHSFRVGTDSHLSTPTVIWPRIQSLEFVANEETRFVAVATTTAGERTLLWYVGDRGLNDEDNPPTGAQGAVPCEQPLGVELLRVGSPGPTARLHCADASYRIPALGEAQPMERPEGEPLRWAKRRAMGQADLWLVARGEAHTLELWRRTDAGYEIAQGVTLPPELRRLAPADRTLPIQTPRSEGGWTARITEANQLEVLLDDGWTVAPSTRWPQITRLSDYEAMAMTLGYETEPEEARVLRLWFHSLGPNDPYWGHHRAENPLSIDKRSSQGIELGDFPVTVFNSPVQVHVAGEEGDLQGGVTICEPTPTP